ncbi:hypothetical protein DL767_005060 [Monosporascus sp. MG133]|nr:hypothetical protein DL767_005060 [Monosporascus sp. MG133]
MPSLLPTFVRLNLEGKVWLAVLSGHSQRLFVDMKIDSKRITDDSPKVETAASNVNPDGDEIIVPYDGGSRQSWPRRCNRQLIIERYDEKNLLTSLSVTMIHQHVPPGRLEINLPTDLNIVHLAARRSSPSTQVGRVPDNRELLLRLGLGRVIFDECHALERPVQLQERHVRLLGLGVTPCRRQRDAGHGALVVRRSASNLTTCAVSDVYPDARRVLLAVEDAVGSGGYKVVSG